MKGFLMVSALCICAEGGSIKSASDVDIGTAGGNVSRTPIETCSFRHLSADNLTSLFIQNLKIKGSGFQPSFGEVPKVYVGDDECEVIPYYSSGTQIVCKTPARPDKIDATDRFTPSKLRVFTGEGESDCAWTSYGENNCELRFDTHRTPNMSEVLTPIVVPNQLVKIKGRQLGHVDSINFVKVGDQHCQLYNESSDAPFQDSYYGLTCLLPEGSMKSGMYNITMSTNYGGYGDMLVLPQALRINHRTGKIGVIDVAANTYSVEPTTGSLAGGQEIVIKGAGYSGEAQVRVGGTPCTVISFSDGNILCKLSYRQDSISAHAAAAVNGSSVRPKAAMFQRGMKSYARTGPIPNFPTTEFTIDFWMKSIRGNNAIFSYIGPDGTNQLVVRLWGTLRVDLMGAYINSGDYLHDGAWHHVAISWRSHDGMIRMKIDGKLEFNRHNTDGWQKGKTLDANGTVVFGNGVHTLSTMRFHNNQHYWGALDGFRVWSKCLPLDQVAMASRASVPASATDVIGSSHLLMSDVLCWYTFDSPGQDLISVNDSSTNRYDLAIFDVDYAPGVEIVADAADGSGPLATQMERLEDEYWSQYQTSVVPPLANKQNAVEAISAAVKSDGAGVHTVTSIVDFEGARNGGFAVGEGTLPKNSFPYLAVDHLFNPTSNLWRATSETPATFIMNPTGAPTSASLSGAATLVKSFDLGGSSSTAGSTAIPATEGGGEAVINGGAVLSDSKCLSLNANSALIAIGRSSTNTRCVCVNHQLQAGETFTFPASIDKTNWLSGTYIDTFSASTPAGGSCTSFQTYVCAQRTNSAGGWGMDLKFIAMVSGTAADDYLTISGLDSTLPTMRSLSIEMWFARDSDLSWQRLWDMASSTASTSRNMALALSDKSSMKFVMNAGIQGLTDFSVVYLC
jgi:hypothetical protein